MATEAPLISFNHQMTNKFYNVLHKHFPGTLPLEEYMKKTFELLEPYGFEDENTMGMVALCRDEITEPLFNEVVKYWGKTFNCCSLGGFLTIGKTGLHAATERRFMMEFGDLLSMECPILPFPKMEKLAKFTERGLTHRLMLVVL